MKRLPQIDRFFTAVCSFLFLALFILFFSCEKESLEVETSRIKAVKFDETPLKILLAHNDCGSNKNCI